MKKFIEYIRAIIVATLFVIRCCLKFILGWVVWLIILGLNIIFSTATWNWRETYTMNMEYIIKEMCGESTWKCMMLGND